MAKAEKSSDAEAKQQSKKGKWRARLKNVGKWTWIILFELGAGTRNKGIYKGIY